MHLGFRTFLIQINFGNFFSQFWIIRFKKPTAPCNILKSNCIPFYIKGVGASGNSADFICKFNIIHIYFPFFHHLKEPCNKFPKETFCAHFCVWTIRKYWDTRFLCISFQCIYLFTIHYVLPCYFLKPEGAVVWCHVGVGGGGVQGAASTPHPRLFTCPPLKKFTKKNRNCVLFETIITKLILENDNPWVPPAN